MRDPKRVERILRKLGYIWSRKDQLRLGQLLVVINARDLTIGKLFNLEDDKLEEMLDKVLKNGL